MKIRSSFVSNSSSSSFVINKDGLTEEQLNGIRMFTGFINILGNECYTEEFFDDVDDDYGEIKNSIRITMDHMFDIDDVARFFEHKFNIITGEVE